MLSFTALAQSEASPGKSPEVTSTLSDYQQLQQSQGRVEETLARLVAFCPSLVALFNAADQAFHLAKLTNSDVPQAAGEMRTLLDKFQGELFSKASRWPKENMTWVTMAERLTSGQNSKERQILLDQEAQRQHLISELSDLLKQRTPPSVSQLSSIWPTVVDHILVTCGCVQLPDTQQSVCANVT